MRVALLVVTCAVATSTQLFNVVHIVVDDLRPDIGAYGLSNRHTPNIDNLAKNGTTFLRAYAQQAVCGPSRNSFMRSGPCLVSVLIAASNN